MYSTHAHVRTTRCQLVHARRVRHQRSPAHPIPTSHAQRDHKTADTRDRDTPQNDTQVHTENTPKGAGGPRELGRRWHQHPPHWGGRPRASGGARGQAGDKAAGGRKHYGSTTTAAVLVRVARDCCVCGERCEVPKGVPWRYRGGRRGAMSTEGSSEVGRSSGSSGGSSDSGSSASSGSSGRGNSGMSNRHPVGYRMCARVLG